MLWLQFWLPRTGDDSSMWTPDEHRDERLPELKDKTLTEEFVNRRYKIRKRLDPGAPIGTMRTYEVEDPESADERWHGTFSALCRRVL